MNPTLPLRILFSAFVVCVILLVGWIATCLETPTYPWQLKNKVIPPFQIFTTENPVTDLYMVTYTVRAIVSKDSSRNDIQLISEKIIEGLPPHNLAIICFLADPSEKDKDWTIARTWWGYILPYDPYALPSAAGDYSRHKMKIAMKGQALPGTEVTNF